AVVDQLLLRFRLEARTLVLRLRACERGLLIELLAAEPQLDLGELRARRLELIARFLGLAHQIGVRKLDEHGLGRDGRAGPDEDALDAALGLGGDPADLARHEHARPAHLPEHLALANSVDPERSSRDAGGRGLEPADADRDRRDDQHAHDRERRLADALSLLELWPRYVHASRLRNERASPARDHKLLVLQRFRHKLRNPWAIVVPLPNGAVPTPGTAAIRASVPTLGILRDPRPPHRARRSGLDRNDQAADGPEHRILGAAEIPHPSTFREPPARPCGDEQEGGRETGGPRGIEIEDEADRHDDLDREGRVKPGRGRLEADLRHESLDE